MSQIAVTRRRFLAVVGTSATATVLACQQSPPAPSSSAPSPVTIVQTQVVEKVITATPGPAQPTTAPQVVEKVVTATPQPQLQGSADIWSFPNTSDDANLLWKPLMTKFNGQYPRIQAKVETFPWSGRREKMLAAFAAGKPPDVAYVNTDTLSLFGSNNALVPLDSYIPPEVWNDIPKEVAATGFSWKGKRLMIPTLIALPARVVNQDLLAEAGGDPKNPPVAWSDLLELGAAAKAKGNYLTDWSLVTWDDDWISSLWQAGGTVLNSDATKVLMDQPPAEEALNFIVQLYQKGFVSKQGEVASEQEASAASTIDYFMTGKQLYSVPSDPIIFDNIKQQAPKMKYGIVGPFKNKEQVIDSSAGCWGIFNRSKNVDASVAWINFMVAPENQGFYCSVCHFIPPRQATYTYWIASDDVRSLVKTTAPLSRINQDMNYFFQEGKTTFAPHFQAAVLGKATVKQALADGTKELQKIVDAFWAKQQ